MANTSNFYEAEIIKFVNGQVLKTNTKVDLLDLSALEFDKIVINSDVDLGNGKGADLPDFTKVEINGEFDCSSFSIKKDSVLPRGITALKCFYSINTLDILNGILPESVRTVYVRNAVINAVKKDDNARNVSKQFMAQNPNIEVLGKSEKLSLRDLLVPNKETEVKPAARTKRVKENKSSGTVSNGILTISAVADRLKKLEEYSSFSPRDLKKLIKTFLYNHNHDNYWGTLQNHVQESKIDELAVALLDPKYAEPVVVEQKPVVEKQIPVAQPTSEKENKGGSQEDLKPIQIQKYFYKSVLGYVQKVCKSNKKLWAEFLNNINDVNLNPLQNCERIGTCRVGCLKNGELKLVPNLEMKNFTYIMQGFGRANNRPRVVWCVLSGDLLVAGDYFDNHGDGKNKHAYNDTIQSTFLRDKIQADFQKNPQNYINVKDLLVQLQKENDKQEKNQETIAQEVTEQQPVPEPEQEKIQDLIPVTVEKEVLESDVSEPVTKPVADVMPQEKLPEEKILIEPVINTNNQHDVENEIVKPVRKKRPRIYKKIEFEPIQNDVLYNVNYKLEEVFEFMNQNILKIKKELITETDTEKSIELTNKLSGALKDKQLLEQNLEIVKKTFDVVTQYVSNKRHIR